MSRSSSRPSPEVSPAEPWYVTISDDKWRVRLMPLHLVPEKF